MTMDQKSEGARVASHRMPDRDRPRRAVPAWVVAPPEDTAVGREAPRAPAPQAPVLDAVAAVPVVAPGTPGAAGPTLPQDPTDVLPAVDVVVPDYPPQEHLLPPAPTSPAVQVPPFDTAPLPVSPVDAAESGGPLTPPVDPTHSAHAPAPVQPPAPAAPVVGQPRFSVPGLEHVLVEGAEPEPSGPIGYRTPARFARQQAPRPTVVDPAPSGFDAVIAAPAAPTVQAPSVFPGGPAAVSTPEAAVPTAAAAAPTAVAGPSAAGAPVAGGVSAPYRRGRRSGSAAARTGTDAEVGGHDDGEQGLQADRRASRDRSRTAIGATPAAVLGAVTGVAALALAAWWFTAPATVHATGLVLGVLALALSVTALRTPAATWQRPVALLGAVLGGVGALVLLWAVAAALLAPAGVTLPDLTGTGTTPTLAP